MRTPKNNRFFFLTVVVAFLVQFRMTIPPIYFCSSRNLHIFHCIASTVEQMIACNTILYYVRLIFFVLFAYTMLVNELEVSHMEAVFSQLYFQMVQVNGQVFTGDRAIFTRCFAFDCFEPFSQVQTGKFVAGKAKQ